MACSRAVDRGPVSSNFKISFRKSFSSMRVSLMASRMNVSASLMAEGWIHSQMVSFVFGFHKNEMGQISLVGYPLCSYKLVVPRRFPLMNLDVGHQWLALVCTCSWLTSGCQLKVLPYQSMYPVRQQCRSARPSTRCKPCTRHREPRTDA